MSKQAHIPEASGLRELDPPKGASTTMKLGPGAPRVVTVHGLAADGHGGGLFTAFASAAREREVRVGRPTLPPTRTVDGVRYPFVQVQIEHKVHVTYPVV